MKKHWLKIVGAVFFAFLVWRIVALVSKGSGGGPQGYDRPPVAVEVDSVRYGSIQEVREFTGTVYPYYQYIVAPKVTGRIVEIRKRIGDWVRAGEVIARIDDAEYQQAVLEGEANLKIAEASLAEAESQYALATQELERVQSLQEKGIASSSELDAALTNHSAQKSRLELAKAQLEQREASLTSAKIRRGYTVLGATKPGFIGERFVDEGSLLAPNSAVVSVVGIDTVIVRTTIIERDYSRVQPGQASEIQVDAFPTKRFHGTVSRIAPVIEEASRVAKMEVEVSNDSLILKPGMFANVRIVLAAKDSTQMVPSQAVVSHGGINGVFTIGSGEAVARYVSVDVGIVTPHTVEITSPKLEGLVVTLGQHLLEDGSPVILPTVEGQDKLGEPEGTSPSSMRDKEQSR